jgi:CheY-like chemotaxis protein
MPNHDRPVILELEDREEDVILFAHALERAGVSADIRVVTNGQEAIDYLRGEGKFAHRDRFPFPDLVLLDLKLPVRTGFDVLKWIRSEPALRTLLVVTLTSSVDRGDVERAYQLGANAFLVKPSSINTLADMCRAIEMFWLTHNEPPVVPARDEPPSWRDDL